MDRLHTTASPVDSRKSSLLYCRPGKPSLSSTFPSTLPDVDIIPANPLTSIIHGQSKALSAPSYKAGQSESAKDSLDHRVQSLPNYRPDAPVTPPPQVRHEHLIPISKLLATEVPIDAQERRTSPPTTAKSFPTEHLMSVKRSPCMLGPDTTFSSPTKRSIQLQVSLAPDFQQRRKGEACRFCERSFKRCYERKRHERTHTTAARFRCSDNGCQQKGEWGFTRRDQYRKHMHSQHGVFVD